VSHTPQPVRQERPTPPAAEKKHVEPPRREERPSETHKPERPIDAHKPDRPALDGPKSLREALAAVTGKKPPEPTIHAPDLKSTLHTVAPSAENTKKITDHVNKPVELPREVLENMLAVDEKDDGNEAWLRDK
jgi:hypothetical protein